eukprot:2280426-Pyramimonas_sp.AAC.1
MRGNRVAHEPTCKIGKRTTGRPRRGRTAGKHPEARKPSGACRNARTWTPRGALDPGRRKGATVTT